LFHLSSPWDRLGAFQYWKKPYPCLCFSALEVFSTSIGKSFNFGENVSVELFIAGGKMAEGMKKSKATWHRGLWSNNKSWISKKTLLSNNYP
jgi:hypothetical protein